VVGLTLELKRPMRVNRQFPKRGASAVVELALVMPVFFFFILGQIETTRLGMVAQILTTAAREGVRIAVINGNTNTDVTNAISTFLTSAGISGVTTTQTPADCTTVHIGDSPNTISVSLIVPFSSVSWLPTPYFLKTASISSVATMTSERP
jgi:Flp pilus assembly protein TadG